MLTERSILSQCEVLINGIIQVRVAYHNNYVITESLIKIFNKTINN